MARSAVIQQLLLPDVVPARPDELAASPVKTLAEAERDHILAILHRCKGRIRGVGGSAELLGVPPSTLESKMTKLGIHRAQVFSRI